MRGTFNQILRCIREVFVFHNMKHGFLLSKFGGVVKEPLRWFKFKNWDNKSWCLDLSSHELSAELCGDETNRGYNGVTLPDNRLILIDSSSSRHVQNHTVLHEIMHASIDGVDSVDEIAEENVITKMAPRLYPILCRFGLQWPERPARFKLLEQQSRRYVK